MKFTLPLTLFFLISCSTRNEMATTKVHENVNSKSFKKQRALAPNEINDFYSSKIKGKNPALQEETLDRYTLDELAKMTSSNDSLFEISLACSKKDYNKAFAEASKSYERFQKIPAYWTQIANCHLNQGNSRKAMLFYNKALEIDSGYVPALNNIGVLYQRNGDDQKALVAFEKANKQSRFSKTPRYNLAKLYLKFGLADLSLPLLNGLLNDSPEDVDLLNAVATANFFNSNYSNALSYYQKIPRSYWIQSEVGLNLVMTLKKLGKDNDALKLFNQIQKPESKSMQEYYATIAGFVGAEL